MGNAPYIDISLKDLSEGLLKQKVLEARASSCGVSIEFTSHHPERFAALCEHNIALSSLLDRIDAVAKAGITTELSHVVHEDTVDDLIDLPRFIDDRFEGRVGLQLCVRDDQRADLRPFVESALHVCRARELRTRVNEERLPPKADPRPASYAWTTEQSFCEPERVVVRHIREDQPLKEALRSALAPYGGIARFVAPQSLGLTDEQKEQFAREDSRDARRLAPSFPEQPRVLIHVGQRDADEPGQLGALLIQVLNACADLCPNTAVLIPQEANFETWSALCAPFAARILQRQSVAVDAKKSAEHFDIVLSVSCAQNALNEITNATITQTMAPLDAPRRDAIVGRLLDTMSAPDAVGLPPLSTWLSSRASAWFDELDMSPKVIVDQDGSYLDLPQIVIADLWIRGAPELGLVLAGMDPLPMDRILWEAHHGGAPLPGWLASISSAGHPYARIEGIRLDKDVPGPTLWGPQSLPPHPTTSRETPLVILGVASTTLQNHGAALLVDGVIVAAVQEERLRRKKQEGWHPPGQPTDTVVSNPRIPLERSYPWRSIRCVLDMAGLTLDDVDCIAHNGIPQQFFESYKLHDPDQPPQTIRFGRSMFIPHHLAHAASTFRVSGMEDGYVFTVDGRGERETAAFFEVQEGRLHRVFDVLCNEDSLIGGVYEYFTTILGFGHHGAGSTMGLSSMGKATMNLSRFLSAKSRSDYTIHDRGIRSAWGHLGRERDGPLHPQHKNLAASLQEALEQTVINLIKDGLNGRPCPRLALAGGVALNCRMNQVIRNEFGVEEIFVQPAANDAGTALGAALEAHFEITGTTSLPKMESAYLGPSFSNDEIEDCLIRFGMDYRKSTDIASEVAQRLTQREVICWFQGGLEFGPRALGGRSIVADPRTEAVKDRINVMKGRQDWRPLGPSILSGHEADWFEHPMHSPFMLFTLPVIEAQREKIPAVLHVDGTTRPQSVTEQANPRYHKMITSFFEKTGVPMVVNTSFNTAFEPIVHTPEDAVASFLQLGADALAIGDFIVSNKELPAKESRQH